MADYINKIRTTEGDKPVNYEALANKPNSLPNPNKIKFTGSVVAEYDGSSEVTVNIPNGASEEQAAQIQTNTNDISELKNKTSELKGDLVKLFETKEFLNGNIYHNTNTAATKNSDGTITIGITDYGTTIIDGAISLKKGKYKMFGVPLGYTFISPDISPASAIKTNRTKTDEEFVLETDGTYYIGIRIESNPSSSFTVKPSFTMEVAVSEENKEKIYGLDTSVLDIENRKADKFSVSGVNLNNTDLWENGYIDCDNGELCTTQYFHIRTKDYVPTYVHKMLRHRTISFCRYNKNGIFIDGQNFNNSVPEIYYFDHKNYLYRIAIPSFTSTESIDEKCSDVEFYGKLISNKNSLTVKFNYPSEMDSMDVSAFDFSVKEDGYIHILEDVYQMFDSLMSAHPNLITKTDVASLLNKSYPSYANGQDGTPAYKTYMYTLKDTNVNAGNTTNTVKKKLLIVGGLHGNELAAPVNLYLLAKSMVEISTRDMFSLFSAFDIYIIPCINGWGMYHCTRTNANGVNINRNFPIKKWSVTETQGDTNYSGESASSEFETQLIVGITDYIKPDMCIDHHNYGSYSNRQFYTEVSDINLANVVYQSMQDCSYAFKKGMPNYFGNNFDLLVHLGGTAPYNFTSDKEAKLERWWYENDITLSSTLEIGGTINYQNGTYIPSGLDVHGNDTFSVAQYTIRNLLCHYAEYMLKQIV